jgi:hypothetical protein
MIYSCNSARIGGPRLQIDNREAKAISELRPSTIVVRVECSTARLFAFPDFLGLFASTSCPSHQHLSKHDGRIVTPSDRRQI